MNLIIAVLAGAAGGMVTAVLGLVTTLLLCQALHVPDREGAVGYLAVFFGLLSGLAGMIASPVLTLRFRKKRYAAPTRAGNSFTISVRNDLASPNNISVRSM